MVAIPQLIATENQRFRSCVVVGSRISSFNLVATRLINPKYKAVYQRIEAQTKVPWFVIGVIHEREAGQNFACSIAQGDKWDVKSTHVPRGRGPFESFEEAAYDALVNCAPKAGHWTDWSIGGILTILEMYNGLGYANMGRPSPYIWAGTNQYAKGKYTGDGHYDPNAVDTQLGCAGLLMAMASLDKSLAFGVSQTPANAPVARLSPSRPIVPVIPAIHDPPPSMTNPAAGSIGSAISKSLASLLSHL